MSFLALKDWHFETMPCMNTYEVRLESHNAKVKHRVVEVLFLAGLFFMLRFCWSAFYPTPSERSRGLTSVALEVGVTSLLWGIGMAFFRSKRISNYKLFVDEDSISGVLEYTGWLKWLRTRRTVRKGKVRSIFEIKGMFGRADAIGISERSMLGARIWGFVYVPKTLREYDNLKQLAEGWRVAESAN